MGLINKKTAYTNIFGDPDRPIYGNELLTPIQCGFTLTSERNPEVNGQYNVWAFNAYSASSLWCEGDYAFFYRHDGNNLLYSIEAQEAGSGFQWKITETSDPLLSCGRWMGAATGGTCNFIKGDVIQGGIWPKEGTYRDTCDIGEYYYTITYTNCN